MAERETRIAVVLTGPVILAVGCFCLIPLGFLFAFSFFQVDFVSIVKDPTLANYERVATSETYRALILKALSRGLLIAAITAVLAYPLAFYIAKRVRHVKAALLTALLIPLYTGDIIRIFAWRVVLGAEGALNTFLMWLGLINEPVRALLFSPTATVIVLTYNYIPFMVLGLWLAFENLDDRYFEAAADLGAGRVAIFRRVVLPLTMPGLFAGGLMVFALVIGDYLTPQLIGGSSGVTVISAINDLFGTAFDWPLGSAIAWTLLAVLFVVLAATFIVLQRHPATRSLFGRA
ncbi:MAG: ABC transporter permease [Hyphomicrobiales bacterium]|nr:ABC transporter permease [Hyphomicrobiales bacterium]